ncbi:MAG: phytanoyl-CoA dioxygenase family protein [Kofleriaceae bacterium]
MLRLEGWLPAWDLERRHANLDRVIAWARTMLGEDALETIRVGSDDARALARKLTQASLDPELRRPLHAALREIMPELPWEHVLVQTYAHFRILCPGDHRTPVPPHCDRGFGHALDERNVWIALTPATGSGALHVMDLDASLKRLVREGSTDGVIDDPALAPIDVEVGDALLFTPLHLHAAHAPEQHTRVSIDLRIVPAHGNQPGASFMAPL